MVCCWLEKRSGQGCFQINIPCYQSIMLSVQLERCSLPKISFLSGYDTLNVSWRDVDGLYMDICGFSERCEIRFTWRNDAVIMLGKRKYLFKRHRAFSGRFSLASKENVPVLRAKSLWRGETHGFIFLGSDETKKSGNTLVILTSILIILFFYIAQHP